MKPLHAQWTAETLLYVATQEQWMENALRGVGIWDIMTGEFVPDPAFQDDVYAPAVATAEEAAADKPDTDSEYEFVSDSEQEAEADEEAEEDVDYNLETKFPVKMNLAHLCFIHPQIVHKKVMVELKVRKKLWYDHEQNVEHLWKTVMMMSTLVMLNKIIQNVHQFLKHQFQKQTLQQDKPEQPGMHALLKRKSTSFSKQ